MPFNDDFQNDPKGFANRYAFYPSDEADGYVARNEQILTGAQFAGFRHTTVDQAQKIARVDLAKGADPVRGEVVLVRPSLNAAAGMPIYFLPWDHRGAAVELTIPNLAPTLPEDQHPRIFFTAVLSGCTIMFKGTAQSPTIFHCGTGGKGADELPTQGDSNQFFRNLLDLCNRSAIGTPGAVASQVRSDQYMVPRLGSPAIDQMERDVRRAMEALYRTRIRIVATSAWGMVFGFRAQGSRDWRFYMQQNVTIQYYDMIEVLQTMVEKKFGGLMKTTTQTSTRQQGEFHNFAKPIELMKVFPGAGARKATSTWRAIRG